MSNELLFIIQTIIGLAFTLVAFSMGRNWLYGYIAVCIVLANVFVTKQITLFGIPATGGNVLFGSTFLATDLLSEHFGKRETRQAILLGFGAALFYLIMSQFILKFSPSPDDWGAADGMATIFDFAPAIVLATLMAYLISQFHDIWAFHWIREKTGGRYLWLRNNGSTWVSQLIDSVVFSILAFLVLPILFPNAEALPFDIVVGIIISTYFLKILVAAIDTPFIYLSHNLPIIKLKDA